MTSITLKRYHNDNGWRSGRDAAIGVVGGMWVVFLLQTVSAWITPWGALTQFGLQPRNWECLLSGPIIMPFLHGNWEHLISNTVVLLPLLPLYFLSHHRMKQAWLRLLLLWLGSGWLLWLIGPGNTLNIGASGLVYALTGYMMVYGLRGGHWIAVIVAVVLLIFQAGAILGGLLPNEPGISYAGHWSGLLVGGVTGFTVKK